MSGWIRVLENRTGSLGLVNEVHCRQESKVLMMQTLVLMGRRLPREEWPWWEGLAWLGVVELHRC